ncbi:MAG: DUF397 domain-containing protein [Streptomyces sp.]|uniref:DUF397 domain-containing protein n=1 Tax=Streptomyces sp. TaxID=1931 RepID=UPI003D6B79FD
MNREEIAQSGTGLHWVRSSYSDNAGGECVEVAWRKSSYSDSEGAECVEVATRIASVHIRDSKDTDRPALRVSRTGWARFVRYATAG